MAGGGQRHKQQLPHPSRSVCRTSLEENQFVVVILSTVLTPGNLCAQEPAVTVCTWMYTRKMARA